MTFNELNRAEKVARLQAHLAAVKEKPVQWGEDDCTTWCARWVEIERGIKIPKPYYRTRDEAYQIIDREGGLLKIWERYAVRHGLCATDYPDYGDIGLVDTSMGPVGVIFSYGNVGAWRTDGGATFLRPRTILKAWSV